ncbi:hypothetical protein [Salinarimonas ramus]|nr:hypothetical protein [Salinarimonas ramus]
MATAGSHRNSPIAAPATGALALARPLSRSLDLGLLLLISP